MKRTGNTIVSHKKETMKYYDTWASRARSVRYGVFGERMMEVKVLAARRYMRNNMRLLDAGCGIGNITAMLAERNGQTVGMDFSSVNLRKARDNLSGRVSADIVLADLTAVPLVDESVDIVVSFSTLYYVEQLDQALGELCRVLGKGGYAVFDLGNRYSWNAFEYRWQSGVIQHLIAPSQMKRVIGKAHLEVEAMRVFQLLPSVFYSFFGRILSLTVGGRLVDEWISSAPPLRNLAFRYLWLCRRANPLSNGFDCPKT